MSAASSTCQSGALCPIQQKALLLIATGATLTAAAQSVGVHRNTVSNWMAKPQFRDALHLACFDQALEWRDAAMEHALAAIAAIVKVLHEPKASPTARLKAAQMILDRGTAMLPEMPEHLADINPYPDLADSVEESVEPSERLQPEAAAGRPFENAASCTILHKPDGKAGCFASRNMPRAAG